MPAGANQPVHWFIEGKKLGIQQGTSVWVGSPKSSHAYVVDIYVKIPWMLVHVPRGSSHKERMTPWTPQESNKPHLPSVLPMLLLMLITPTRVGGPYA